MSSRRGGRGTSAAGRAGLPKEKNIAGGSTPRVEQLSAGVANVSLGSTEGRQWEILSRKPSNRGGSSSSNLWVNNQKAWGQPGVVQKLGFHAAPQPEIATPLHGGWNWKGRPAASQFEGGSESNKVRSVDKPANDDFDNDDDSDAVYSDDELLSDDFDSDESVKSHDTRKQSRWFKGFFKRLDDLTLEQISEPGRQWHCPACAGGPGAIDWYVGLQPLMAHAKTKGSKRVRLHRDLAELLDEELRRRGTSVVPAGEAFGKWTGLAQEVKDREIVWPPMVCIMNTQLEQDDNDKWIGMGNQELLDYFSAYNPSKARHSYGPQGHRGMSVLIFTRTLGAGYLGDGLDYWKGFYQSLRLTQMGLSLNVDMSAGAFYSPILVSEFVQQSLNIRDLSRPLSDQDRIKEVHTMSSRRGGRGTSAAGRAGLPKEKNIAGGSTPRVEQLSAGVANVSLGSTEGRQWEILSRKPSNRGGSSSSNLWVNNQKAWGQPGVVQKLGFHAAPQPEIATPLHGGWNWKGRPAASQFEGGSESNKVRSVDKPANDDFDNDDDSDAVYSDDELLSDDFDSDESVKSHDTRKQSRWFKGFFKRLDDLTLEQISEPGRQWHCPACAGGPGAIDWYVGLQPLMAHAKTKGSKRVRLHRDLAELLDEELRRRGTSVVPAGEAFGKWTGLAQEVKDREIVWPPMVCIMNTQLEQDDNDKWIGMGNQELLDYFSAYNPSKARHSYGPQGHRGMSVLIFTRTLGAGYLGDGLDYWKGFYQSLRLTQMGLSLNVDMSAGAFYSPILVSEFVQQSLNIRDLSRPLSDQDRIKEVHTMSSRRGGRGTSAAGRAGLPKEKNIAGGSTPRVEQLSAGVANVSLGSTEGRQWEILSRKPSNRGGSSSSNLWVNNQKAWGQPGVVQKLGFHAAPQPEIATPLHGGWNWKGRPAASQFEGGSESNKVRSVDKPANDDFDNDDDSDAVYSDDELLSDDFDSDESVKSHDTRKQSRWFKGFFKRLDDLTLEQISEPGRQWHCPACAGGPGAIDWYVGLQPLMAHAKTKGSKRVRLHRDLAELLDEELRRRGTSVVPAGEAFGKWTGLAQEVKDREIVWPPMVCIMNTQLEQDDNDKWIGMGNQELLDYFSAYNPSKARHSYGPQGHRGMSVLIFTRTLGAGYLGDGLDYWKGFYQSLRLTQMGLSLNVDMSARALLSSTQVAPASSKAVRPPVRPGRGTLGRKCVVRANRFLVEIADKDIHRYDVTVYSPHEPSMMLLLLERFKMFIERARVSYLPTSSEFFTGLSAICGAWSCFQNLPSKQKEDDAIQVQNQLLIDSKKLDDKRNLYLRQTNQYLLEMNHYLSRGWYDWLLGTTYKKKYQEELAAKKRALYLDKLVQAQRKRDQLKRDQRDQQQEARETEERREKIKKEVKQLLIGCFW